MGALFVVGFFFAIIWGIAGAIVGEKKRMGSGAGFAWGFFLGPIGLIVVAVAEPAHPTTWVPYQQVPASYPPHQPGGPPLSPPPGIHPMPSRWFADPTNRFELRYWDGVRWTEHVARAGQQFRDPI